MAKIKRLAGPYFLDVVTTPDYRQHHPRCRGGESNEWRYLAWHGDALLDLIITEHLLARNGFATSDKQALGQLTARRQQYISREALARFAQVIGLDKALRHHESVDLGNSRNICAERMEALIAAIFKHSGEKAMREFVYENIIAAAPDCGDDTIPSHKARPVIFKRAASKTRWPHVHKMMRHLPKPLRQEVVEIEQGQGSGSKRLARIKKVLVRERILKAA